MSPAASVVPKNEGGGPGVGIWFLGFVLLCALIAAAYFGYQIINTTGNTNGASLTTTAGSVAFNTNSTVTAAARVTASRPVTTVAPATPAASVVAGGTVPPADLLVVPNFFRLPQEQAQEFIRREGFTVGRETRQFDNGDMNTVIAQDPKPGSMARRGTPINITISSGPENTDLARLENDGMPFDPRGKTYMEVEQVLRERGLRAVATMEMSDLEAGRVTRLEAEWDGAQRQ